MFAAIVGLLNDKLIAAGKSPMGWLNPFIYSKYVCYYSSHIQFIESLSAAHKRSTISPLAATQVATLKVSRQKLVGILCV
jgi:hypothetical protein